MMKSTSSLLVYCLDYFCTLHCPHDNINRRRFIPGEYLKASIARGKFQTPNSREYVIWFHTKALTTHKHTQMRHCCLYQYHLHWAMYDGGEMDGIAQCVEPFSSLHQILRNSFRSPIFAIQLIKCVTTIVSYYKTSKQFINKS